MRIVYMGRKPTGAEGLRHLISRGLEVVVVVGPTGEQPVKYKDSLFDLATQHNIPTTTDSDLYRYIDGTEKDSFHFSLDNIDLIVSVLFPKILKKQLIELPDIGCINFHPAPLPDYRGFAPYSFAIYEKCRTWGVSSHFMDETFDTGDIIKVNYFDIDPAEETAYSLEQKSQKPLLELFDEVFDELLNIGKLKRIPQGEGWTRTKEDFEKLREIRPDDSSEDIERKIRAFWYPPYPGAAIKIKKTQYTVINEKLLKEIGSKYHN